MTEITKQQAKRFILTKQGLIGSYRFTGKKGALDYTDRRDASSSTRWMYAERTPN